MVATQLELPFRYCPFRNESMRPSDCDGGSSGVTYLLKPDRLTSRLFGDRTCRETEAQAFNQTPT
jgi:hypothetical protein